MEQKLDGIKLHTNQQIMSTQNCQKKQIKRQQNIYLIDFIYFWSVLMLLGWLFQATKKPPRWSTFVL